MKKTILIGTILAVFLMLMVPNISALSIQTVEKTSQEIEKEAVNEKGETIKEKLEIVLSNNGECKVDLDILDILDRILGFIGAFIAMPIAFIMFFFTPPGWLCLAAYFVIGVVTGVGGIQFLQTFIQFFFWVWSEIFKLASPNAQPTTI